MSDPNAVPAGTAGERVSALARALSAAAAERGPATYMEVCGTHTMAISRFGLRELLPESMRLVSGPGCPVCVTATGDLDVAVALARLPQVTLVTFGDLMRVPASRSTLADERAAGADVRVVYSAADAVELAARLPEREVVFVGIGFETTAPTVAAAVISARDRGLANFSLLSLHKTMPGALRALLDAEEVAIEGFLLPGHVSVITGSDCYRFVAAEYGVGGVVAGLRGRGRARGPGHAGAPARAGDRDRLSTRRASRGQPRGAAAHGGGLRAVRRRLARAGDDPWVRSQAGAGVPLVCRRGAPAGRGR